MVLSLLIWTCLGSALVGRVRCYHCVLGGLVCGNDPIFSGLLGLVHGAIGALDYAGLIVRSQHLRDASAEGD